jgi:hypothetical protein
MDDVIRYTLIDFQAVLDSSADCKDNHASRIVDKLEHLLKTRECFTSPDTFPPHGMVINGCGGVGGRGGAGPNLKRGHHGHHPRGGHRGYGNNQQQQQRAVQHRPIRTDRSLSKEARLSRELTGCCNKLNLGNFKRISAQIERCFHADTATSMAFLLSRCVLQSEFLTQYLSILRGLFETAEASQRDIMQSMLDTFAAEFVSEKPYLTVGSMNSNGYTGYCEWVARKKSILGRHRLVLGATCANLLAGTTLNDMFVNVHAALFDVAANDDIGEGREEALELILDMLSEFFRLKLVDSKGWKQRMVDAHLDGDLKKRMTVKCQVKLLNIVE